jgi:hypothetical protein
MVGPVVLSDARLTALAREPSAVKVVAGEMNAERMVVLAKVLSGAMAAALRGPNAGRMKAFVVALYGLAHPR